MPKTDNILNRAPNLAQKYGTPAYIYDFDKITQNVQSFKNAFNARKSMLCYALKANSNLSLLKHLATLECGADCVSINEVKRALLAGIPKYKIIYSGVGKSDSDIKTALDLDILFINVESVGELLRVEAIAREADKVARISVRVNPNIDAKTHPYISTGLRENKFGVEIESAKKMFIYAKNSAHLQPIAVHFHIGSQLLDLEPITQSAGKIVGLIKGLIALKIDIKFIDIGGGLGIAYNGEKVIDLYDYAQGILAELKGLDLTIISELGRRIVGDCGVLLTSILYEKQNEFKRFCVVDAAMNDLVRPALYGAKHRVEYIPKGNSSLGMQFRTCGNFGDFADSKSSLNPQNSHKYKSHTANTRIVDSGESSLRGRIVDSPKQSKQNKIDCHDSALPNLAMTKKGKCAEFRNNDSIKSSLRGSEATEAIHDSPAIPDILQDSAPFLEKCDIVGPICESSDYLAKDIALPRTNRGDLLVILDSGAYGFSMSSNYNSRLKCVEVALHKGRDFIIRKRESFDESIANEAECADLQTKGGEK